MKGEHLKERKGGCREGLKGGREGRKDAMILKLKPINIEVPFER